MKSSLSDPELTIGQLADHFGLATHVLRHWEAVGLLTPARRVNGRRRYGVEHLTRVAIIVHGKEVGFRLDDLRELLAAGHPGDRRAVLERHRAELDRRIARARASRELIDHALACESPDFMSCPNFQVLLHDMYGSPCTSAHEPCDTAEQAHVADQLTAPPVPAVPTATGGTAP